MIALTLGERELIQAHDLNKKQYSYIPERQVLENISNIWVMLEQVIQDWTAAAKAYPSFSELKKKDRQTGLRLEFETYMLFKPRIFQSLFSYIIFLFMLENGYHFVYYELNHLNRDLELKISPKKAPKRTEFINNLWKVRNFTIAHWASTEKKNLSDSIIGRSWGSFFGSMRVMNVFEKDPFGDELVGDMEHIIPGISITEIPSIPEIHNQCSIYLREFDQVCADYRKEIIAHMPKILNGVEYHSYKWTDSGWVTDSEHLHV